MGSEMCIRDSVTPGTGYKITYDRHGLITSSSGIDPADYTPATTTELGAVMVPGTDADGPTALVIGSDGALTHSVTGVDEGIYPKVSVNKYGHVVAGLQLSASDIPDISYDQITSGVVQPGSLAEDCVTGFNIADYAIAFMQEASPGVGEHLGQFWFQPSTAQLRIYARGSNGLQWAAGGFGALQANNLRWGGAFDASTGNLTVLTAIGLSAVSYPHLTLPTILLV